MTKLRIKMQADHLYAAQLPADLTPEAYNLRLAIRFEEARTLGWMIKEEYLCPPPHFECAANQWAAYYQGALLDYQCVSVPHWFWDDTIMRTGTRNINPF